LALLINYKHTMLVFAIEFWLFKTHILVQVVIFGFSAIVSSITAMSAWLINSSYWFIASGDRKYFYFVQDQNKYLSKN
jgi:hypothetical protein